MCETGGKILSPPVLRCLRGAGVRNKGENQRQGAVFTVKQPPGRLLQRPSEETEAVQPAGGRAETQALPSHRHQGSCLPARRLPHHVQGASRRSQKSLV